MKRFLVIISILTLTGFNLFGADVKQVQPRIERAIPVDSEHNRLLMQKYVVLPPGFEGQPVIIENSTEYKSLLESNKTLKAQIDLEKKASDIYRNSVDKTLIEKEQVNKEMQQKLAKLEAQKNKHVFWNWVLGSLAFLIPAGIIALCIFYPPIIGILFNLLVSIVHGIGKLIAYIFSSFKPTLEKIQSYKEQAPK